MKNDNPMTDRPEAGGQPPAPEAPNPMTAEPPRAPEPPPGTYPGPGAWPANWPPPEPPKKTRRVGTITMALCLIVVGVLMVLRVFVANIDYTFIMRLSPVVLILLGIEMVVANIRFKEEKLRYDFLSVFISIILIFGSLVAAAVPEIVEYEIYGERTGRRLAAELEQATGPLLQEALPVSHTEWHVSLYGEYGVNDIAPEDLRPGNDVQVRVFMPHDYASEKEFAADCRRALDIMLTKAPYINYASFYSSRDDDVAAPGGDGSRYTLWLSGVSAMGQSAEQMTTAVETQRWHDGYYMDEWEYESMQEEQREAGELPDPEAPDPAEEPDSLEMPEPEEPAELEEAA